MSDRLRQLFSPRRLTVERLKDRNPPATTFDAILNDLWLPASGGAERPLAAEPDEAPTAGPLPADTVTRAATVPTPAAEGARPKAPPPDHTPATQPFAEDLMPVADAPLMLASSHPSSLAAAPPQELYDAAGGSPSPVFTPAAGEPPALWDEPPVGGSGSTASSYAAADPTITLTAEATHVPLNANNTNKSAWRTDADNHDMKGIPYRRDLAVQPMRDLSGWDGVGSPPPGPPIADPELKKMTATVTNGQPQQIRIWVWYKDAGYGGRVRLWREASKTTEIGLTGGAVGDGSARYQGTLPNFPTSEFYIEGVHPSLATGDIKISVEYGGNVVQGPGGPVQQPLIKAEKPLTVTPIVKEFSGNPKTPPQTLPMYDTHGNIAGLTAGNVRPGLPGIIFTADFDRTNLAGKGVFVQNVMADLNGSPAAVVMSMGKKFNVGAKIKEGSNPPVRYNYPFLDSEVDNFPLYPAWDQIPPSTTRHSIAAEDSPWMPIREEWPGVLFSMDKTTLFRMHLMWQYADGTLYNFAYVGWSTVFRGSTPVGGAFTIDSASVTAAGPPIFTTADPARMTPPYANEGIQYWEVL